MPKKRTSKMAGTAKAAPDTQIRPELMELGGTGLQQYGGLINEEWLRQLQGQNALRVFREMSENDPIIGAILYAIEMLLKPVTWTVESEGTTPGDEEAKEYVDSLWGDMSHTSSDFISEWMACPIYGYAPFEIVLKLRNGDNEKPGLASKYSDGKIGVRKLAIRHPATLDRWLFDDAGGIQGMVQRAAPKWTPTTIPIERMLLFRALARKGNPEGTSLLRRAYTSWFYKKKLEGIEAVGIERNTAGFPLIYYPAAWLADSAFATQLTEVKEIVKRVKVDDQAGLALPSVFDEDGNRILEFSLVSSSGKVAGEISPIIERYARHMAMSVLADVILLGHEKVGSFALADSKTNLFTVGLGALLDDIRDTMNRHLIPRLIRMNGFKVTVMPTLQHSDLETVDLTALGDLITKLAAAGFPLFPSEGGEIERHILRAAGLPVPENFPVPAPMPDPFAEPDPKEEEEPQDDEQDELEKHMSPVRVEYGEDGRVARLVPEK